MLVEVDDEDDPVHKLGSSVSDLELVGSNPGPQTLDFSSALCQDSWFVNFGIQLDFVSRLLCVQLCSQFSARSIDQDSFLFRSGFRYPVSYRVSYQVLYQVLYRVSYRVTYQLD
jgi:hypothetical protein